jgi:hypothetical protein
MEQQQLTISRLVRVNLREVWEREDIHFTQWLAQEENIRLLGETLGLELIVQSSEQAVGPFRADILCKDAVDDSMVLIENQLERTDHKHLGQLMTYAAGLDTATIIWVAQAFTEEHRAALDWLNRITEERFNFFGVEVELWRIADSPVAPKFNIIAKPNHWSKVVRRQSVNGETSSTSWWEMDLLGFWTRFKKYLEENSRLIKPYTARADIRFNVASPAAGYYLRAVRMQYNYETNDYSKGELRVVLEAVSESAQLKFAALQSAPERFDNLFGGTLKWKAEERKLFLSQTIDIHDEEDYPRQFKWLMENLERVHSCIHSLVSPKKGVHIDCNQLLW